MTRYKFGDVVLLTFPQSGGTKKKRPALIILDIGDSDIVVAPITTKKRNGVGECQIKNWKNCGLLLESWARLAKVSCLAKRDIERPLGSIVAYDRGNIISIWNTLYDF